MVFLRNNAVDNHNINFHNRPIMKKKKTLERFFLHVLFGPEIAFGLQTLGDSPKIHLFFPLLLLFRIGNGSKGKKVSSLMVILNVISEPPFDDVSAFLANTHYWKWGQFFTILESLAFPNSRPQGALPNVRGKNLCSVRVVTDPEESESTQNLVHARQQCTYTAGGSHFIHLIAELT